VDSLTGSGAESPKRVLVSAEAHRRWSAFAATTGLPLDESIELALRAAGPDADPAATKLLVAWHRVNSRNRSATTLELGRHLRERGVDEDVLGVRLAPRQAAKQDGPIARSSIGADLGDPMSDVWTSSRGFFRHNKASRVLVAYVLGQQQFVFGGLSWLDHGGLVYSDAGYGIVNGRRIDPATGDDLGPADPSEAIIETVVSGSLLSAVPGARNPVCWISRRGGN
jgi:hypothetical protein